MTDSTIKRYSGHPSGYDLHVLPDGRAHWVATAKESTIPSHQNDLTPEEVQRIIFNHDLQLLSND